MRLMGDIYSIAQHTIIFLGQSSPHCNIVLKMTDSEALGVDPGTSAELLPAGQFEKVIEEEILARPWFTRVWILQELILSRDPWLQCGKSRIRWNVFCEQFMASSTSLWTHDSRLILKNMIESRSKFRVAKESILDQPDPQGVYLFELLSRRRGCGLSDPRDMVYALLSLAGTTVATSLAIDYDKSVSQVYEDFTCLFTKWTSLTEVLSHVEEVRPENRKLCRPSWILDWSAPRSFHRFWGAHSLYHEAPSRCVTVGHILAFRGGDVGFIDSNIPRSSWPEVDVDIENGVKYDPSGLFPRLW